MPQRTVSSCSNFIRRLDHNQYYKLAKGQSFPSSTARTSTSISRDFLSQEHLKKPKAKQIERDFFLSVLSTSATRRDAKAYLSRFKTSESEVSSPTQELASQDESDTTHLALIKLLLPAESNPDLLNGLSRTFSQLARLGLSSVIVVDGCDVRSDIDKGDPREWRKQVTLNADRLVSALQRHNSIIACRLEVLGTERGTGNLNGTSSYSVLVQYPELLIKQVRRGVIPVICPVAHMTDTQNIIAIDSNDAMLSLTRTFGGLDVRDQTTIQRQGEESSGAQAEKKRVHNVSLDRIIILDPAGGVPSKEFSGDTHIFINMEQEYDDIRQHLLNSKSSNGNSNTPTQRHLKNLKFLHEALALLPPSSSALLMTPEEAAAEKSSPTRLEEGPNVGTRRPKNPLIHNLLTGKPLISSSLPSERLDSRKNTEDSLTLRKARATFVKRGMALTLIPNPYVQAWQPPKAQENRLNFQDSRIDFSRLLNLIEDSFNRPLDVEHYLNRVHNKIAGIIVAGEYEGGAILTWELPPGVIDDGSEASRKRMVPYLDKFAVLKKSQGAGGVADIVFTAMVKDCFPEGVCWRSRKNNPVNKWYFERAVGSWKLPSANWTMFWTSKNLLAGSERWLDYEAVCRHVQPSWADNKQIMD